MRHTTVLARRPMGHLTATLAALLALTLTVGGCATAIRTGQGAVRGAASASPLGAAIGHGIAGAPGLAIGAGLGATIGGTIGAILALITNPPAVKEEKENTR